MSSIVLMIGTLAAIASSQHEAPMERFDFVSISRCGAQSASTWNVSSNGLSVTCQSLLEYIERAYGVSQYQVVSMGLVRSKTDRYNILARTAAAATEAEIMQMLKRALTERFQLRLRHVVRRNSGVPAAGGVAWPEASVRYRDAWP